MIKFMINWSLIIIIVQNNEALQAIVSIHEAWMKKTYKTHQDSLAKYMNTINELKTQNEILTIKWAKMQTEISELIATQNNMKLIKSAYECSVFNYEAELREKKFTEDTNLEENEQLEQSSSVMMSIAKEDSFESTLHPTPEYSSNFNWPSRMSKYDISTEMWFNKMRNDQGDDFDNISEKSDQCGLANNLQNNMKQFQMYHIGRNQNMKNAKSLTNKDA